MAEHPEASQREEQPGVSTPELFDPKTMRKSKPGFKRLFLTISVLLSFLSGVPFFLKSIEIYRSPIPFTEMDTLSNSIDSHPLIFLCRFHVVFVDFDSREVSVDKLAFSVLENMRKLSSSENVCGSCGNNYSVSVTIESGGDCKESGDVEAAKLWKCGRIKEGNLEEMLKDDERFDEYLNEVLGGDEEGSGKVYRVVVVSKDEEIRAVVGKNRHAWIVGRVSEVDEAVEMVAEVFVKVFVNGGTRNGSIHSEFMPVGADGRIVLSFNLLNADPRDWVYDWNFQEIDEILLAPIIRTLAPLANISTESQVLYHTPMSSFANWDKEKESYIFRTKDLPFFVNSNEWHLDTSIAAGGRSKILQFVVYVPSANECPLLLQLPNGEISMTNGFISPMWGGVVVWNPPRCVRDFGGSHSRNKISPQDLEKVFEVFLGQLRQIFGLNSGSFYHDASTTFTLLSTGKGFTEWEMDFLSRQHTCYNLLQCGTTLGSLSRLVQSLPRMIIKDEIGKQVKFSLEAAKVARSNASYGISDASAVSSREARILAEDAFFHPSMMSVSYYSFEHCFAVYSPFFLPVSMHIILAVLREFRRYKQESAKHRAWGVIDSRNA
nr:PREDICTED: GPI transamidase component PIG-S-like isoform X1 [Daucus carota subsp. sativus]